MPKTITQKTKGKLSKKELKQDKLVEFAYKAERYYREHQKLVFGIGGAILAVALGFFLVQRSLHSSRLDDSYQLTMARLAHDSGRLDEARTAFQQIVSTRGSSAAAIAKYYLGKIALAQGNFSDAETEFRAYIKDFSVDEFMDCGALTGLAAACESQGKLEEASKTFVAAAEKYPDQPGAPQSLSNAARLYIKINQIDKAKELLRRIKEKYPESTSVSQAKRDLEALE